MSVTEAAGWEIDRLEIEGLLAEGLMSVCQVPPARRAELLAWIDARIVAGGGGVEEVWRRRGKRLSKVSDLLELTRIRRLLVAAMDAAEEDCPFWLTPDPEFTGRQIPDDQWHLAFEGGGKVVGSRSGGRNDFTGGGAGRLLAGRTFGSRLALYTGAEVGGSADFPRDDMGERGGLVFGIDVVLPLVFRWRLVNSYYDLELGWLSHLTEEDPDPTPGLRVGIAIGARALRQRWFFPGAAFAVSYERTFPDEPGLDPLHLVKVGLRVSIELDL